MVARARRAELARNRLRGLVRAERRRYTVVRRARSHRLLFAPRARADAHPSGPPVAVEDRGPRAQESARADAGGGGDRHGLPARSGTAHDFRGLAPAGVPRKTPARAAVDRLGADLSRDQRPPAACRASPARTWLLGLGAVYRRASSP